MSQYTQENNIKGKGKRKHNAHAADDDEHTSQKKAKESSDEEFVFVSALTGTITQGSDAWLVDSGASKHLTHYRGSLTGVTEKDSSLQMELGDNSKHAVKGVGEASYKLESSMFPLPSHFSISYTILTKALQHLDALPLPYYPSRPSSSQRYPSTPLALTSLPSRPALPSSAISVQHSS